MDAMAAIRQTFFQECDEQLGEMEIGLLAMQAGEANAETVNSVFRAVHSIKGGAGAFKFERLVRFAHAFETTLDRVRCDRLVPTAAVMKTMLRCADVLADLVKEARDGEAVDESRVQALSEELHLLSDENPATVVQEPAEQGDADPFGFQPLTLSFDAFNDDAAPVASLAKTFLISFKPAPELYDRGNETARLLRELDRLGDTKIECDTQALPLLDELDPRGAYFAWKIELTTSEEIAAVEEVFDFVVDDCELEIKLAAGIAGQENPVAADPELALDSPASVEPATMATAAPSPVAAARSLPDSAKSSSKSEAPVAQTIRVDLDRVDRLANLVGELVISQAMLSQRVAEAGLSRGSSVAAGLTALDQLTREIQEGIMAIRAQPVKPLFQRMTRTVRELADSTGKLVRLRTEGEATEVDRTVFEKLADPLTHMIRNAIDHGIESPADRVAAGKPDHGEIQLSAAHRSGRIMIDVIDDGRGIDRARVKAKAIEKDLIPAEAQLSNAEIDNLLFLPGFSTAATVSDISGRGVGMDVVKSSIQALGGRICIASRPGQGTTFSMSLPLTLAVLDGMVVKVADETLVVPITAIVETLRPKPEDVHCLGVGARVLADRAGYAPLLDVGRELGYRAEAVEPHENVVIVVESETSTRCALIVDAILDQRQVVIKSLETNFQQIPSIAAATILGDGRVALILDIDTFVADAANRRVAKEHPGFTVAS